MRRLGLLCCLLLCLVTPAIGWDRVTPEQAGTLLNSTTTGATNTAVTKTIASVTNQRIHLYGLSAFCSAGSSTVTVSEGGTLVWTSTTGGVGTTMNGAAWTPVPHTTAPGNNLVVTLATCGGGNTGTLNIEADQW